MKPDAVEALLWFANDEVARLAPELPLAVAVEPKFIPVFWVIWTSNCEVVAAVTEASDPIPLTVTSLSLVL
jgi:hypothetical protein